MYGILLPIVFYLLHPTLSSSTRKARITLAVLFVTILSANTAMRASDWSNPVQLALTEVRNHPDSARSQYQLGLIYWQLMERQPESAEASASLARQHFMYSRSADPNNSSGLFALLMLDARAGNSLNVNQLNELMTLLRSRPFLSNSVHHLRDLSQCQAMNLCQFLPQQINGIFNAALNNPTLQNSTRAKILSEAMIIALMQGDLKRALAKGEEAMHSDPEDPQHGLNYSSVLIQSGRLIQARSILQQLKNNGIKPFLHHRLAAQLQALSKAEEKIRTNGAKAKLQ